VIAENLCARLQQRNPGDGEVLFPVDQRTCGIDRRTSKMMRRDPATARQKPP